MATRRKFIRDVAALTATASFSVAHGFGRREGDRRIAGGQGANPDARPARIASLSVRDDTLVQYGGDCVAWQFSWAADDRQVGAALDGPGWPELPKDHYKTSNLLALSGESPHGATFEDFPAYPDISMWESTRLARPGYYGFSTLAVEERLYHFLSLRKIDFSPSQCKRQVDCMPWPWNCAKLIYSPDNGRTWHNEDGSTPVVLESWNSVNRETMTFLEPDGAFGIPMFLQMGRGYRDNQDGYVYAYGTSGLLEGTMNQLVMFRVPKNKVHVRAAYEYFEKRAADGGAVWVKDIRRRGSVHAFPSGYVNNARGSSWMPTVIYNAPLKTFMLFAAGNASDWDSETVRPTYMGVWISFSPWGPWTQVHEQIGSSGRNYLPDGFSIPPKWIAPDGKSFWIAYGDGRQAGMTRSDKSWALETTEGRTEEEFRRGRLRWRLYHPYSGFNFKRVDLVVA